MVDQLDKNLHLILEEFDRWKIILWDVYDCKILN
jgi:hypothetical protein